MLQDRATGRPRGFGFVTFATREAADAAIGKRITIKGRVVRSSPSVLLYCGLIRTSVPSAMLLTLFCRFCQHHMPAVPAFYRSSPSRQSLAKRCAGGQAQPLVSPVPLFCTSFALCSLARCPNHGSLIVPPPPVSRARPDAKPTSQNPPALKLFVGGLATSTDDDGFRLYFEKFGSVAESQVVQDHATGASRGFGFITYDNESSVEAVVAAPVRPRERDKSQHNT